MTEHNPDALKLFILGSRPSYLVGGVLFYALGAGIVHFLGNPIDWVSYWVGLGMVLLLHVSGSYLFAYYNFTTFINLAQKQTTANNLTDINLIQKQKTQSKSLEMLRILFLQAGLTTLTIGAVLTVMLSTNGSMNLSAYFLIGISLVLSFSYAMPPTQFGMTGYGDLINTFLLAVLTPAFAYVLQAGELHRLLAMLSFPLSILTLAAFLALLLEGHVEDLRTGRKNLMTQLGWQRGMQFHNLLIFLGYLLFGLAAVLGLPWGLTWPAVLSLPVGVYQVWQMRQIANGAKPHWSLLRWTAYAVVAMTVYLLSLALWTG